MATRIFLAAAYIFAPIVTGFGPAAVTQKNILSSTLVSPSTAALSNFRLPAFTDKNAKGNGVDALSSTSAKIYSPDSKETPKVLGGVKIGLRKLVVITGASSGLGLSTTIAMAKTGKYHIVMACRDVEKAKKGEKEKAKARSPF